MDRFYLGVLQGCSQLGGAIIRRLVSHFGSGRQVWQVQAGELAETGLLRPAVLEEFLLARKERPDWPLELEEICHKRHIHLVIRENEAYPELLKEIANPPEVLF